MAYFAEIDTSSKVLRVVATDGIADDKGYSWLVASLGGVWVETSNAFRLNYAGISFTYDADRDAFIPPTPYPSWVLDEDTCLWVAPIAYPAEGDHVWDEQAGDWVEVTDENS